jgi:hypothetical protein
MPRNAHSNYSASHGLYFAPAFWNAPVLRRFRMAPVGAASSIDAAISIDAAHTREKRRSGAAL